MSRPLYWSKYILPNGREVYLTQRPEYVKDNSVDDFIDKKGPIVRICFCDDYVQPPKRVPWHWLPWVPGKDIPIENVFAFISMMDKYNLGIEIGPIWLHCDFSSMRAPTFFGLYLSAIYPDKVKEICEAMTVSDNYDAVYAEYSRADKYASISFRLDSGVKNLIEAWQKGGEKAAHEYYMELK